MPKLLLLLLSCLVGTALTAPRSPAFAAEARADAVARVQVAVIHASKSGAGLDDRSKRYASILENVPQFTGFKHVGEAGLDAPMGQAVSKEIAGRTLTVTLTSIAADKVSTKVDVLDAAGKHHGLTSSLKPGATMVVAAKSADGSEAHLFVVTVSY
jgi:hypothetical protein